MITSVDEEKSFDKIQYPFMIKIYSTKTSKGHNIIPTTNITFNSEKLKAFHLILGTKQGFPLSPLFFFYHSLSLRSTTQSN